MGGPIPWHGRSRALPTTWPSQGTTQRSTGSKWATAWQRSTHVTASEFFFPSSVTNCEPDSTYIRPTKWVNSSNLWPVFTSQGMLSIVSAGIRKNENDLLYFLPFQTFWLLQYMQLSLPPHLSLLGSYSELVLLSRDVWVCIFSYGFVFWSTSLSINCRTNVQQWSGMLRGRTFSKPLVLYMILVPYFLFFFLTWYLQGSRS